MVKSKKVLFIFFMLFPTFFIISTLNIYPTIKGIILSFQNFTLFNFNRIKFIGLKNYIDILTDPEFPSILLNTLLWIVCSVIFQFLLGFGLAILMKRPFKGRSIYAGLVFYPWALSGFAIGLLWSWLLNGQFGIINDILLRLGLIDSGINFLSDPKLAMFSVIIVNIWYGIPFFAIMLLAALQSIPDSLYEAAEIDGAGPVKKLIYITIPYIKPTIINTILLRSIWIMNFPDIIYGMTRGGPAGSTNILAVHMINIVYYKNDYSKASTVGVIILTILMIYTIIYLRITESGVVEI
ncbi:MAG: multiple sugar transport system permease protein [Thermotogaceae bacterium]|nr:multiple sugar transport system permease protein [Thermotogaceae bacterium]MDN5337228.1 multiple sugar transport system permease protein [Thermotogaceae bacterium]